ncbi:MULTISPECIES: transcriptional regulator NodD2 [Rhizobium]|jgi:LysR family nod box-dependent transcriptional activator|uniref:Nodulation protein D 2 n=16 Tax=Rhizobium TaxID=379 RepID=NODD2_RHILP|nr:MULTISPECIES: transcriptional regulator NodD2 [Rhizobium]P23719.1 RecName: Full=Nodulation protein D 2 [Rhizobium leguminosarum bv. phaseoli]ACE94060.1 nod transcriptional regulator protein, LysR family [Rhizobium etli CIAT 652]EGE56806.1 LysR family NOD transcriptional regulator protein [Rhizobium etli CNPAF512]KEC70605.1 LysR family transcriptional regulator [Rhizobium leguminosarum bv. phaseoli CCGM1]AAM55078.1 nod transcriptional regulator protein, LysR family [Rhizobium etli CFN 42]AN
MRFKGLDLNLLVALDALTTERNLTAAARSINLSQPAMSAAIGRLRDYFRDELFTMNGRELRLTPRAEGLASAVRETLLQVQCSIISWEPFNPSKSDRCFRIVLSDFMMLIYFNKIIERVAREAPAVSFELLPLDSDPYEMLSRGDVDFLIVPEFFLSGAHPSAKLFTEKFVCVACSTNVDLPSALTIEQYVSTGHVAAAFGRFLKPSVEGWFLLENGIQRRVEVVVQGFSLIPPVLRGTNRIANLPLRLVEHYESTFPLRIINLPLPLPVFTEAVQWPALHNADPGSIWFREILVEEASRMMSSNAPKIHGLLQQSGS